MWFTSEPFHNPHPAPEKKTSLRPLLDSLSQHRVRSCLGLHSLLKAAKIIHPQQCNAPKTIKNYEMWLQKVCKVQNVPCRFVVMCAKCAKMAQKQFVAWVQSIVGKASRLLGGQAQWIGFSHMFQLKGPSPCVQIQSWKGLWRKMRQHMQKDA